MTDTKSTIPVSYTGVLPDLFGEGQGMVGTGRYVDGVFQATEILAKHDETYMPKEVVDALKEQGVYVDPNAGTERLIGRDVNLHLHLPDATGQSAPVRRHA